MLYVILLQVLKQILVLWTWSEVPKFQRVIIFSSIPIVGRGGGGGAPKALY